MDTHIKKYVPMTDNTKLELLDGHKSHINLTLAEWGRSNNIVSWADLGGGGGQGVRTLPELEKVSMGHRCPRLLFL